MKVLYVDKIVENDVVCEDDQCREYRLSTNDVPSTVREGDVLIVDKEIVIISEDKTAEKRSEMNDLRREVHLNELVN